MVDGEEEKLRVEEKGKEAEEEGLALLIVVAMMHGKEENNVKC